VLFADIKGSTELIHDLDPEEARALIDPVLRLMIEAVHRYEGYVAQSTGDGIFALFGAPVAHEDLELGCVRLLKDELDQDGAVSKPRSSGNGARPKGYPFSRGALYALLSNPLYIGEVRHRGVRYQGCPIGSISKM
jgi:class 3 adenylate cyclase